MTEKQIICTLKIKCKGGSEAHVKAYGQGEEDAYANALKKAEQEYGTNIKILYIHYGT